MKKIREKRKCRVGNRKTKRETDRRGKGKGKGREDAKEKKKEKGLDVILRSSIPPAAAP